MPENEKKKCCANCMFHTGSWCHFDPPRIFIYPAPPKYPPFEKHTVSTMWPKVKDQDWCGKYEPRTSQ